MNIYNRLKKKKQTAPLADKKPKDEFEIISPKMILEESISYHNLLMCSGSYDCTNNMYICGSAAYKRIQEFKNKMITKYEHHEA